MKFLQSLCTIIAIFISVTVTAQDADQQQNPDRGMEKILTPEQLALLKEQYKDDEEVIEAIHKITTKYAFY